MQEHYYYKQLLQDLQLADSEKAERLEEEVDILIHKLKFIAEDQRPTVLILNQHQQFAVSYSSAVADAVSIAGGSLLEHITDNPSILIIQQQDGSLYSALPELLQSPALSRSSAVLNNKVFIIQNQDFNAQTSDAFLVDVETLAEIIQPKYFIYGRNGISWVKFDIL